MARASASVVRDLRVVELVWADATDPSRPLGAAISLEEFRRRRRERAVRERSDRERIDWRGFAPDAAPQEVPAAPAPTPPVPTTVTDSEEREWHLELRRIVEAEVVAHVRDAMASGRRLPTAGEYRRWSDERLAALRADGEAFTDRPATEDEPPARADVGLDLHPLNRVMERVAVAQGLLRRAEAARVEAAATAWKAALESVTGTPDATVNGPFERSILMQLAHDLQVAEQTAAALVHAAVALEERTPRSWSVFLAGEVPWRGMQLVAAQLGGLDASFWCEFDERASAAIVRTPMPRLKDRLRVIRERIQAVTAVERHERALASMGVTVEPAADGMAVLTALLPAPEALSIDLRLDQAARAAAATEGEDRPIGRLRAHILLDLIDEGLFRGPRPDVADGIAVPQRRGVECRIGVLIPAMTALGASDVPATLEGYGPIDLETAKRLAGGATSWIKVLTDPVTGAVETIGREKYRPTADMRTLLSILDGAGRGPNSARPPSRTEADHIEPFRQGLARGETALRNLVLLAVRDHRIKTSGLWDIELRDRRDLAWTSFMGTRIITTVEPLEPTPVPPDLGVPPPDDDCPF